MAGGTNRRQLPPGWLAAPWRDGESAGEREDRLHREHQQRQHERDLRAATRPQRPGFAWISVGQVERPALVMQWHATPEGWTADVAWTDDDHAVHVERVDGDRLVPVDTA